MPCSDTFRSKGFERALPYHLRSACRARRVVRIGYTGDDSGPFYTLSYDLSKISSACSHPVGCILGVGRFVRIIEFIFILRRLLRDFLASSRGIFFRLFPSGVRSQRSFLEWIFRIKTKNNAQVFPVCSVDCVNRFWYRERSAGD